MLPEEREFSDEQAESVYFFNKTATCEFSNFEKMRKSSHNYNWICWSMLVPITVRFAGRGAASAAASAGRGGPTA